MNKIKEKIKNFLKNVVSGSVKAVDFVGDFETQKLLIVAILILTALLVLAMGSCTVGWLI